MEIVIDYVNAVFTVFLVVIFIRILLSWVPNRPTGRVTTAVWNFFHDSTDWYLRLFRRIIPTVGMFDFSPIIALVVLYVANAVVVRVLALL
jgi:YggT family protein